MSRLRVSLISAGLVVATATLALNVHAQPPGGRAGRNQRGNQRGSGGPGNWSGPAGQETGLIGLAQNEVVQKELNVNDKQKSQLTRLTDDQNTKRKQAFEQVNKQQNMARQQIAQQAQAQAFAQQIDPSLDARGSGAGNPLVGALNQRGYVPPTFGGRVPMNDPIAAQQQAQLQARMANNELRAESRQLMMMATRQLQMQTQQQLGKILDRNQMRRLRQIELQMDAPFTVLDPEVAEHIELGDDQAMEIQPIMAQASAAKRQTINRIRNLMSSFMRTQTQNNKNSNNRRNNQRGATTKGNATKGAQKNQAPAAPSIDQEALKKYMDRPEVKAQLAQALQAQERVRSLSYAEVSKILDRRQMSSFQKLLGDPFDVDALEIAMAAGPLGPAFAEAISAQQAKAEKEQAKSEKEQAKPAGNAQPAAPANEATKSTSKSATSKRQRRGAGGQ
jgi:hypothetical protein